MPVKSLHPLLIIAVLAGLILLYTQYMASVINPPERIACDQLSAAQLPAVTLFTTSWCTLCKKTRWFLEDRQIDYCEYDIEKSHSGSDRYHQLAGNGIIPLILIGSHRIDGFNQQALTDALIDQGLL